METCTHYDDTTRTDVCPPYIGSNYSGRRAGAFCHRRDSAANFCRFWERHAAQWHKVQFQRAKIQISGNIIEIWYMEVHVTAPPQKKDFENEKYLIILYLFCTILYTESKISYTIPSCAIGNSNLGGWRHAAPQMQFQHKKLDHNFVLILYNFVHRDPNFVYTSSFG